MRKLTYFLTVFTLVFMTPFVIQAKELPSITPENVARILQTAGLSYQSKFDSRQRPRIVVTDDLFSQEFQIYFFDCQEGIHCQSITLWSWYNSDSKVTHARANLWNQKNRFAKSYLDKDFQAVLEMDIQGVGGIGKDNLSILINAYLKIMPAYAQFMGAVKE